MGHVCCMPLAFRLILLVLRREVGVASVTLRMNEQSVGWITCKSFGGSYEVECGCVTRGVSWSGRDDVVFEPQPKPQPKPLWSRDGNLRRYMCLGLLPLIQHFLPRGSIWSSANLAKMERVICQRPRALLLILALKSRSIGMCVGRRRSTSVWHGMLLVHPVESCKLAHGMLFACSIQMTKGSCWKRCHVGRPKGGDQ